MKILFADDDHTIYLVVKHVVEGMGHELTYAHDGKEAIALFNESEPDLVILDVMMPKIDGFDVCNIIRQVSDVPVIFLTAKADILDKSIGFRVGGDDYLSKPFAPLELELRIDVLLRRQNKLKAVTPQVNQKTEEFNSGDLRINYDNYQVFVKGEEVIFTLKEFTLLSLLTKNAGVVFSRNQLIEALWGKNYVGDINALTLFIHKLREKIEENPSDPRFILTVWGVGYKFVDINGEVE